MAKPTGSKTKPETVTTWTVNEIHLVPGRFDVEGNPDCQVSISATNDDPDQKDVNIMVPMQTYVDSLSATDVAKLNSFLGKAFADAIGVDPGDVTGEFISQTP